MVSMHLQNFLCVLINTINGDVDPLLVGSIAVPGKESNWQMKLVAPTNE
jgi:hypothetical protein